jgi:WD40 repeat protein
VFYESPECVLVAAGTAFGEIVYWSWTTEITGGPVSRIHRVFTGHEGSIFGVRISKELPSGCCQTLRRIIASCSDDRTIRIWDVSAVIISDTGATYYERNQEEERTQHTGFSNVAFDSDPTSSSDCLAIGWGHTSRVWSVQFLESTPCDGALLLLSDGEDASSRSWKLSPDESEKAALPYKLLEQDCATHHNGKNIWSSAVYCDPTGRLRVVCGAADSKITTYPLVGTSKRRDGNIVHEYTVYDTLSMAGCPVAQPGREISRVDHRSSKKAEFFRSYCFIDDSSFLLTTNSGKVLVGSLQSQAKPHPGQRSVLSKAMLIDQPEDLSGYSVCAGYSPLGVAFIGSSKGAIYAYTKSSCHLLKLTSVHEKVGELLAASVSTSHLQEQMVLLATLVGGKTAQLLFITLEIGSGPFITSTVTLPLLESSIGSTVTSINVYAADATTYVFLGFRRGSVAVYSISDKCATLLRVIEQVHGEDTVTALKWFTSAVDSSAGHLLSVGRDGALTVHDIKLNTNSAECVHKLALPVGPYLEGLFVQGNHLLVHGFSSKRWMLYDVTTEEEVMGVDTGGAHRSWAFEPDWSSLGGGTLVWTRASSMHICSQSGPDHTVVRPGGHGREIKAVAVSVGPSGRLIATGAEDTDIKLFQYTDDELVCRKTLRRHTTGIQHLQWSEDGEYLFSSGGCEEFYIWRIRHLPTVIEIGVVCEHTFTPGSVHADLRIMSFEVTKRGTAYLVAMVFSDSSLKVCYPALELSWLLTKRKVYRYDLAAAVRWQPLATGLYFTSCLTQCTFVSRDTILTAGTDGHTVLWPVSPEIRPSGSANSTLALEWEQPIRIHQSSSKTMSSHRLYNKDLLTVSGGDDGSLAFLLTTSTLFDSTSATTTTYASPPLLLSRAHASAVTACAIIPNRSRIFVLTSGNDEWVRLWELIAKESPGGTSSNEATGDQKDTLEITRLKKIKTNVADVSCMSILDAEEGGSGAQVLICGVGMEVVRVEWEAGHVLHHKEGVQNPQKVQ